MNKVQKIGLAVLGGVAVTLGMALPASAADAPFDYSDFTDTIFVVLGGLGAALGLVLSAALLLRAITWGVPKLVKFFIRLAG